MLFAWGAIGTAGLAVLGNDVLQGVLSPDVDALFGPSISAPPVEELAKGAGLVAAFAVSGWAGRRFGVFEFDGVTDGIVYGAAIGLGFAFTEDLHYLVQDLLSAPDTVSVAQAFEARRDFLGLNSLGHALTTAAFGAGLGLATWSRTGVGRIGFPLLGMAVAIAIHAFHNGFGEAVVVGEYGWDQAVRWNRGELESTPLGEQIDDTFREANLVVNGIHYVLLLALVVAGAFWLRFQRRAIASELKHEVGRGLLDADEVELVCCYRKRARAYRRLLAAGRLRDYRTRVRLDHELAEYALLAWRARHLGVDGVRLESRRAALVDHQAAWRDALTMAGGGP